MIKSIIYAPCFVFLIIASTLISCSDSTGTDSEPPEPQCDIETTVRIDTGTPETVSSDWSQPIKVGAAINNLCPQDAIEISADGTYLYFLHTEDIIDNLTTEEILADYNNTYRARRTGGPGDFDQPEYYNLAKGITGSMDGECSFNSDGTKVYFHSNRITNTGYQNDPFYNDFEDIYVADITDGEPGVAQNLGPAVNSVYPDGEHAIHPDDTTLYFTSLDRPGGTGGADIYVSVYTGGTWQQAVNLGSPINTTADELQPAFTSDGDTLFFTSDRDDQVGTAIYRSVRTGATWGTPELMIRGICGEPSLTADGQLLYFVHVLMDGGGIFDADVYYCTRQ